MEGWRGGDKCLSTNIYLQNHLRPIVIIGLSGNARDEYRQTALASGMNECIPHSSPPSISHVPFSFLFFLFFLFFLLFSSIFFSFLFFSSLLFSSLLFSSLLFSSLLFSSLLFFSSFLLFFFLTLSLMFQDITKPYHKEVLYAVLERCSDDSAV